MKHSFKIICTLCVMLATLWQPQHSNAQTSYSYGTSASETFRRSAVNPTDNSFLAGGFENTTIDPGLLVNIDNAGNLNWAKKYVHSQSMDLMDIHMNDNGNAVVLFRTINTASNVNRRDALLMEVDASGVVQWSKTYVNTTREVRLTRITALSSGDYILTGNASHNISTSYNNYYLTMMKVDATGNKLWLRRDLNDGSNNMAISGATESADGNLLIAGHMWYTINNNGNYHNGYVAKIDVSDGSTTWNNEYPSSDEVNFYQLEELASGDIVIAGKLANSNLTGFTTFRQLFVKINSTGTVLLAKEYNLSGGNTANSFKIDDVTGNIFFAGIEAATNSTSDRNNYWMELTDDGDFVDAYKYTLSDYEGTPMLEINDASINIITTTKSFLADPAAAANNDFAMFLVDRSNPLEDCNINQFSAEPVDYSFDELATANLDLDEGFTLTEADVELIEEEAPFLQADICFEEEPLVIEGIATDDYCELSTGNVDITVSGGLAPYTYSWSNSATTEDLSGVVGGAYFVTVTDDNATTTTGMFIVQANDMLVTASQTDCDGMNTSDTSDDLITITVDALYNYTVGPTSSMYNVYDDATNTLLGTFSYPTDGSFTVNYTPTLTLRFEDFDNAECFKLFALDLAPCSPDCDPLLACPEDIFTVLNGTGCEVAVDYAVDYDDCNGAYTLTLIEGLASGSVFPLGTTVVTYELSNGVETITCSFNVNVSNVAPVAGDFITVQDANFQGSNCYELTPDLNSKAGAVWYQKKMNLDYDFELNFEINLGARPTGADGMMFILQPLNTAIGGDGGNLGFSGVSPSVGLEFDTYYNGQFADPINDHISFQKNGILAHNSTGHLDHSVPRTIVSEMEDGNFHDVIITWNATTKDLTYVFDGTVTATVNQDIVNTIFGGNPNVFWGWSAGTASRRNRHQVCVGDISFTESITAEALVTDIPCEADGVDGMIDLTVSGGVAPYTFAWSDGTTGEDLSPIITAGVYSVTITDACGNMVVEEYEVAQKPCPCTITGSLFMEGCDNQGTCDSSDDLIFLQINATNGLSVGMFNAIDQSTNMLLGTFSYNVGGVVTIPYAPFISVTFEDVADPTCITEFAIDLQGCSEEEPANLACPEDIFATLDGTGCEVAVDYAVDYDDCNGAYTLTLIEGLASGSVFPLGTTVVTYELSNGVETITCSFNVNVSNVAPVAGDFITVQDANFQGSNCYELTPDLNSKAGAVWYQKKMNLDYDFELNFEINLGARPTGADGMMFILQPLNTAIGGDGGNLGFSGVSPSVGLEFDTYYNGQFADPINDHISFQKNGILAHNSTGHLDHSVPRTIVSEMEDGNFHDVIITWNATTKDLTYVFDGTVTATVNQDIVNTIFGGNPNVFWGWSAGTASRRNRHQVCVGDISFTESITAEALVTDIPCEADGVDGMIDLTVSGGVAPYTFAWSDGTTGEDLSPIITAGVYSVTITDACGNMVVEEYEVAQKPCPCTITGSLFMEGCDNQGTCDSSDDLIFLQINATNGLSVGMFNAIDQSTNMLLGTFSYNVGGVVTIPYAPFISVTFEDVADPTCITEFAIDLQGCSEEEPANLACPEDIFATLDGTGCEVAVDYAVDYDDCNGAYTLTLIEGLASGSVFPLGTTVVTYELSNGVETITCSFNVNVSNVAPVAGDFITVQDANFQGSNCYELTPDLNSKAGAVWYQKKMNLDYDFELNFEINLGARPTGADGMMFILQPLNTAIGGDGGNLGFSGVSPSVGLEFDTYYNGQFADPINDHISFQKNGILAHNSTGHLDHSVPRTIVSEMEDGNFHDVIITWNATTKDLTYVFDGTVTATVNQDIVNTIFGGNPNVFWGWSAGTASRRNRHQVCVGDISFTESITAEALVTDVPCEADGVDGMIDLTVSGGVAPYTFAWSDGTTGEDLSPIITAGVYSVTITDACGNMVVEEYEVAQKPCPCTITGSLFMEGCDNQGTCDSSDDLIFLQINATNGLSVGMFNAIDQSTNMLLGTFSYNVGGVVTIPYAPFISVTFEDVADPTCITEFAIDLQGCSEEEPANLACPEDIFATLDGTGCEVAVDYAVDYDDCNGAYTLTLIEGLASGSVFPLGTTVVTYELSNGVETITCSFNVNVSNVAPVAGDFITVQDANFQGSNCYELTPDLNSKAGAVWYQKKMNLDYDFELNFEINLGARPTGADGMMFILQPLNTAIGGDGGNLGFSGVSPSVGLEFDTYYNGQFADPINDHISFQKNGVLAHNSTGHLDHSVPRTIVSEMEDGNFHDVIITWNATTKDLTYVFDGTVTATVNQDIVNTIFGGNPNVFWGWSAGTASRRNRHQVCVGDISFTESITAEALVTDVPCEADGVDGMIDLTVSGGVAPYTFAWSDGTTGEDLSPIITAGVYSVTITDACGNMVVEEYEVAKEECPCTDINITITLDNYPKETSWDLKDGLGNVILSSNGHLGQNPSGMVISVDTCLVADCYEFTIHDSYGDGICCDPFYGNGSYTVTNVSTGTVYGSGGQFGFSETTSFCLGDATASMTSEADEPANREDILAITKPDFAIVNLYPNPAKENVNIEYDARIEGKVDVAIYNTVGQLVLSEVVYAKEGENLIKLDIDQLMTGTYIVEINDGKKKDIERLVIMK